MNISIDASGFLAATALLIAVLLVWAQLWINTYKIYKDNNKVSKQSLKLQEHKDIDSITTLALSWTYIAIGFSILAFASFALSTVMPTSYELTTLKLERAGISFLGSSFSMVVIEIGASIWSAILKYIKGKPFDEPYTYPLEKCLARWLLLLLPLSFLIFSFMAICKNPWYWVGNPAVTVIAWGIIYYTRKRVWTLYIHPAIKFFVIRLCEFLRMMCKVRLVLKKRG